MSAGYGDEDADQARRGAAGAAGLEVTIKGGGAAGADGTPGEPGSITIRPATVVNGGEEVNLRDMITSAPQQHLADRLTAVLGRKYLAHQLVSLLPADVAVRMVDRIAEVVEHQVAEQVERIHQDVDGAVTTTLARLAEAADQKRRELTRERFNVGSRLD